MSEPATSPPVVVKIGGSLAGTERLRTILDIVAAAQNHLVVVPGGGRFADAVREEQARLGFSDEAAHAMALLAMHQMGLMFAAIESRLAAVETGEGICAAAADGKVPVWLPIAIAGNAPDIPRNWSVTSDGLAAWLAARLGSALVVLVKSRPIDPTANVRDLARDGIVDAFFAETVERRRLDWIALGPDQDAALADLVNGGSSAPSPTGGSRSPRYGRA